MKRTIQMMTILAVVLFTSMQAWSHCEVPCGIYDDTLRVKMIREHINTIEKAMKEITHIESHADVNYNQLVRWVSTKEMHADEIQHIASQYFMTQRIKPADPADDAAYKNYITQLTLMHELIIYAMKAKQTVDEQWIVKMRETVDKFEKAYFKK